MHLQTPVLVRYSCARRSPVCQSSQSSAQLAKKFRDLSEVHEKFDYFVVQLRRMRILEIVEDRKVDQKVHDVSFLGKMPISTDMFYLPPH